MAWIECRINAIKQVDHLHKQGMSKRQAIKKLSAESEIPAKTFEKWIWPSAPKNGGTPTNEVKDEVKDEKQPSQEDIWFNVGIKLKQLDAYMRKNCKNSADISNGLKEAVHLYISKIQVFYRYGCAVEFTLYKSK